MSVNQPLLELTSQQRDLVDTLALELPSETVQKRTKETYTDLKSWLTQRAPMPLSHEIERVRKTLRQVIGGGPVADVPATVAGVLEQLQAALPRSQSVAAGKFELSVLQRGEWISASIGRNFLCLSTATIEQTLLDERGPDRLAFLLAGQMASSCLGHCRAWYQSEWAAEFVRAEGSSPVIAHESTSEFANTVLARQSTTAELFSEDMFALHLCRQAGFDVQSALDVLRHRVPAANADQEAKPSTANAARKSLRRLRRLLMELAGTVAEVDCGLHCFVDGRWEPTSSEQLNQTKRAMCVLHGLGSDLPEFDEMLHGLQSALPDSMEIIGLRYPATDSLYRSSKYLCKELQRTGANADCIDFVCHSAGGLVFRHAAEFDGLEFRTATLIGTPSAGSDLASLRPLVEAQEFFGSLRGGFSRTVADAAEDSTAQMVRDLEPGSLFLTELNADSPLDIRGRYRIARGQALTSGKSLLLALGVGTARAALRSLAESKLEPSRQKSAAIWISRLRVPEEVRSGDMAVTLTSATTPDAADVLTVPIAHSKLPEDKQVIEFVRRTVVE